MDRKCARAYAKYFGFSVANLGKWWTPSSLCHTCYATLNHIANGDERYFSFGRPMLWREPTDHVTDCYFCLTNVSIEEVVYPDVQSVTKPVPHSESLPKPQLSEPQAHCSKKRKAEESSSESGESNESEEWSGSEAVGNQNHLLSQAELNDLCRDLYLTKQNSELLASRMQQWGYLAPETRVTYFRHRSDDFAKFFGRAGDYCFCYDVPGLFAEFKKNYDPAEWRLFIDGSKESIKAVLLNKGNKEPSIPIGYVKNMNENYDSIKQLLAFIRYDSHKWKIVADLKIVGILTGMQGGNTKYSCFLCLWDSRDHENHFTQRVWPARGMHTPGEYNVINTPLVDKLDIILPPLHIKLGLMKNFVRALNRNRNGPAIEHLKKMFPKLSMQKVKAGVFIGPQIKKLFRDVEFKECLSAAESEAWEAFENVVYGFLGKNKDPNYVEIVNTMLEKYRIIGMNELKNEKFQLFTLKNI